MTMKWEDTTSYSSGERGKKLPTSWAIQTGPIKVSVTNAHIFYPGYWTMHCHDLRMDTVNLKLPASADAKLAQGMALSMVRNKLKELASAIAKID